MNLYQTWLHILKIDLFKVDICLLLKDDHLCKILKNESFPLNIIIHFSSCVPRNQCKKSAGLLDVRGAGEDSTCEDVSQICCYEEDVIPESENQNTEPITPEVEKETSIDEFDYYDTALCSSLASDGYR